MKKLQEKVREDRVNKIMEGESIVATNAKGDKLLTTKDPDPLFLGTKPIYLSASKPIVPIQFFLPPGINRLFIERIDKNHYRLLISKAEMEKMAEKVGTMEKALTEDKKPND